jgi:lysophospholipase L1-like esterase
LLRLKEITTVLVLAASLGAAQELTRDQLEQELDAYRRALLDWAQLTRYGSDNAELKPPRPGENRVVFLGGEITEQWPQAFFQGKPYINRGILRQTSAQMLVRFRQDVIDLHPKVVVIEAGSNDVASVMGPATEYQVADNLVSMIELARAHRIKVVIAAVPPVCDCGGQIQTLRRVPGKIMGLNGTLEQMSQEVGVVFADFHKTLAQGRLMNKDLTTDGVLPNAAGYDKLGPVVERAIQQALADN